MKTMVVAKEIFVYMVADAYPRMVTSSDLFVTVFKGLLEGFAKLPRHVLHMRS